MYKALVVILLGSILVVYTNCGKSTPLYFESNIYTGSGAASYDAFEKTVYPITRANCISCHETQQPQHASADLKTAHDAIVTGYKVNFTNISNSRLVKKLREDNHNCWGDCEDNALEMENAIAEWAESLQNAGESPQDNSQYESSIVVAGTRTLAEEFAVSGNAIRNNVLTLFAEAAMLNPPMEKLTTPADGIYLMVPNLYNNTLSNNDPSAGTASFNFSVRQSSSSYRLWGLVNAPTTSDNGFYIHFTTTNTGVKEWEIPVTTGWEWRQLTNNTFNFSAGANHTLQIRQRKDGTKIKQIVITSDNSFNASNAIDLTGITLTYDISEQVRIPGVQFKIDLMDYDMYSYKVQNPRIVTTNANIKVRNIKLLVNDVYNPQHSTFTIVDKVVTPQDGKLSDYAMLVIKDKGPAEDVISFKFDILRYDDGTGSGAIDPQEMASLESFRTNLWPVSRNHCISCHTVQNPPHAHDDYYEAYDVVLTQNLVNFNSPANSKLVTKVKGRHNCGTQTQCDAIANQFLNAIQEWKKSR